MKHATTGPRITVSDEISPGQWDARFAIVGRRPELNSYREAKKREERRKACQALAKAKQNERRLIREQNLEARRLQQEQLEERLFWEAYAREIKSRNSDFDCL
jgi:hypothetical protein